MKPQFGASLNYALRVINYAPNIFYNTGHWSMQTVVSIHGPSAYKSEMDIVVIHIEIDKVRSNTVMTLLHDGFTRFSYYL